MTFHSTLTGAAVWPADLVTAGIVSTAAHVYVGRRPRMIPQTDRSVRLERLPKDSVEEYGHQRVTAHPYLLHVLESDSKGPKQSGGALVTAVDAALEAVVDRYHGTRPFVASLPLIVAVTAEEEEFDEDPDTGLVQTGAVRVTFYVKE